MEPNRQITRMLHDEHVATLDLLARLEADLLHAHRKAPPDPTDPAGAKVLRDLATAVEGEISGHFAFEEEALFPLMVEFGDDGMAGLFIEEHEVILPLGRRVAGLARAALDHGVDEGEWQTFRQLGSELFERMISHIQKEEVGLLPLLDDIIDDEADMELATRYAAERGAAPQAAAG